MPLFTALVILVSLLVVSLLIAGLLYQTIVSTIEARRYPPPGTLIDVGGYRLHLYCTGTAKPGVPTVILEAGLGGTCLSWGKVQPQIEQVTRVCSYDRAGYGWSDPGPTPRTSQRIVAELHTVLQRAEIPGPYILVGHSLGGVNVRLYAATYPDEVAGLVLVDAANEGAVENLPAPGRTAVVKQNIRQLVWYLAASLGLVRLAFKAGFSAQTIKSYPYALQPMVTMHFAQAKSARARDDEAMAVRESFAQVRATRSQLSNLPLVVVSAGRGGPSTPWMEQQRDLASLSSQSTSIIAGHSGHRIQFDQPELVVQAITSLLSREG